MKRRISPILSFVLVLCVCIGCTTENSIDKVCGVAMTIPYHIIVGKGSSSHKDVERVISQTFNEIDATFNKWNEESEISRLNHWKEQTPFPCSPELFSMLEICDKIVFLSNGRFDPTVEPLERVWKAAFNAGRTPDEEEILTILPALGWNKLCLGDRCVTKKQPLTSIDLGGIAKGHAVDLLVERLVHLGFRSVYVEWGGEIRTYGQHPEDRSWRVGICHPKKNDEVLEVIETENVALATSGDYQQFWTLEINGEKKQFFHVFDVEKATPLTATSASLVSVTIQHESCCIADALTKPLLFAKDKEEAIRIFNEHILPSFPTAKAWLFSHDEVSTLS